MASTPLEGLKVLDLSRVLAGPYCAQILGDLGAEVIKVESPSGDETRTWTPPQVDGLSAYYLSANRNKKIIRADFKKKEDLAKVMQLIEGADVLIENFRTGHLQKFGLDYESLKAKFPRLIYLSITGFGQTGPRSKEPGYDLAIQALSGLMSITGPNIQAPMKLGVAISDLSTALYSVIAILAALNERGQSGKGQSIDMSLLDVQVALLSNVAMNYLVTKNIPEPLGNAHASIVPYQTFKTKDSRHLVLAIGNDKQFLNFCQSIDVKWYLDPKFTTNELRVKNREAICALIQEMVSQKTLEELLSLCKGKGFPYSPVLQLDKVERDPQVVHRKIFQFLEGGKIPTLKNPIEFSRSALKIHQKPIEQSINFSWTPLK